MFLCQLVLFHSLESWTVGPLEREDDFKFIDSLLLFTFTMQTVRKEGLYLTGEVFTRICKSREPHFSIDLGDKQDEELLAAVCLH